MTASAEPATDPGTFAAALAPAVAAAVAEALAPLAGRLAAPAKPPPLVLRRPVAAEFLGIGPSTLDTLNNAGKTPAPVRIGGTVAYRTADLAEWVRLGCPDRAEFEARTAELTVPARRRRSR